MNTPKETLNGIPLGFNDLERTCGIYTALVVTLSDLRRHLRAERKRHYPNSRAAAKAAGLGASTVAKIENIKSYPTYDPGIGTVEQLLDAMGLTLSEFFLRIEGNQTETDSGRAPTSARNTKVPISGTSGGAPPHVADRSVPHTSVDVAVGALLDISNRVIDALEQLGASRENRDVGTLRTRRATRDRGNH